MEQFEEKNTVIKEMNSAENKYEEMESAEELGSAQDYLTGLGIGLGVVAGIVALT